jgi:mycoredoxin
MDDALAARRERGEALTQSQLPLVYSATWCGYCHRLKEQLDRAGVAYRQIDVDEDPSVLPKLEELNNGEWIIPTVEFADGTALVNPSAKAVVAKLNASQ